MTKNVTFNIAEEEWIELLVEMGCPRLTAVDYVIQYKRDMARHHDLLGNTELADKLYEEIGEPRK